MFCILYTIIGLPICMLFLANIGGAMAKFLKFSYSRICCIWCRARRKHSELILSSTPVESGTTPEESKATPEKSGVTPVESGIISEVSKSNNQEYMPTDMVAVPIVVTLCVMTVYIFFGAIVYIQIEDWTLGDSVYFCFVTLTTLGFGDMVPGQK